VSQNNSIALDLPAADSLRQKGDKARAEGSYDEAEAFYKQSLILCESIEDDKGIFALLFRLGETNRMACRYTEALGYFKSAAQRTKKDEKDEYYAMTLYGMGKVFSELGKLNDGYSYMMHALRIFNETRSPRADLVKNHIASLFKNC
jgi:tetratricopeptide (TPR) repeat protein